MLKRNLSNICNPCLQKIFKKKCPYSVIAYHIPMTKTGFSDYSSRFPSTKACTAIPFAFNHPTFRVNVEGQMKCGKSTINRVAQSEKLFTRK